MSGCVVVYHWWGRGEVWRDRENPVLLAIASLRAHSSLPVCVLDVSVSPTDWGDFPATLGFSVVRPDPFHRRLGLPDEALGWRWPNASQPFDVFDYAPEDEVLFSDADLFWLADPATTLGDPSRFGVLYSPAACPPVNTGLYHFNRRSQPVRLLFEAWRAFTVGAFYDLELRRRIGEFYSPQFWERGYHPVHDEHVLNYVLAAGVKVLTRPLGRGQHFLCEWAANGWYADYSPPMNLHVPRREWGQDAARVAMLVREVHDGLRRTLGESLLRSLFPEYGALVVGQRDLSWVASSRPEDLLPKGRL